ncbi:UDP-glycosyltransferase 73C3 [Citrus sinensis]|nr:UDP-glycosyltransferase 73C3 [Citrus sinensis]
MSPGHQIDMARIFASRGVKATILTTPLNISRFESTINRDDYHHHNPIKLLLLNFPSTAANLPPNCENLDAIPSRDLSYNFSKAIMMLQPQADDLVRQCQPDAIISNMNFPWTAEIARKYGIPRLVFRGTCCFSLSLSVAAAQHKPNVNVSSDTETFLVPGLPRSVYITQSQMPDQFFGNTDLQEFFEKFIKAERNSYGVVANTFFEIEPDYVKHYEKVTGKVVYPVGPVSLFNTKAIDIAERKRRRQSLCEFAESQLLEIALGLESSNICFIWVIKSDAFLLLDKDFEERVKDRELIIKGWAPQVLILNHPAVGGFMTHCGWNSVLESVSSGVPMITWPLFAEQFYNGNFVLTHWKIGVGVGVESGLAWGEEEKIGVLVRRDRVEKVVSQFMINGGEEVEGMRKRASKLSELAKIAVSKGDSSYVNVGLLIDDLLNQKVERLSKKKETVDQFV